MPEELLSIPRNRGRGNSRSFYSMQFHSFSCAYLACKQHF